MLQAEREKSSRFQFGSKQVMLPFDASTNQAPMTASPFHQVPQYPQYPDPLGPYRIVTTSANQEGAKCKV